MVTIRPGDPATPIIYEVDRHRDGRSFTTRQVVAIQHGVTIFTMAASFHIAEHGFEHQVAMPQVPKPQDLPGEREILERHSERMPENMRRYFSRQRPIELRPVEPLYYLEPRAGGPPLQNVWIRATGHLLDDPSIHQCVLAYASDMTLLDTALVPHGRNFFDPEMKMASLDHALWFHRDFRADQWLLYSQDAPSAHGARGFTRGSVFDERGTLVASVAQGGLIRLANTPPGAAD
jgi:acyl-CoA thioesterase-2